MSTISRVTEESAIPESVAVESMQGEEPTIYEEPQAAKSEDQEPSESWWQRITRRVIQDLIGLDEKTLSVIFGEELVEGSTPTPVQLSPLATAAAAESRVTFRDHDHSWEGKLMERIAKELGVLVHQLAEHEGAFSTYKQMQQTPHAYAGLPLPNQTARQPSLRQQRRKLSTRDSDKPSSESLFEPTMPQHLSSEPDTSLWGIEEEPVQLSTAEATRTKQEREYWERDIDVGMIFSYLRRRFASDSTAAQSQPTAAAGGAGTESIYRRPRKRAFAGPPAALELARPARPGPGRCLLARALGAGPARRFGPASALTTHAAIYRHAARKGYLLALR